MVTSTDTSTDTGTDPTPTKVAIIYYSAMGTVHEMAHRAAQAAQKLSAES